MATGALLNILQLGIRLYETSFKASDDCFFVLQRHFSPETLELLLGAAESHVKDIARQAAVELAIIATRYLVLIRVSKASRTLAVRHGDENNRDAHRIVPKQLE